METSVVPHGGGAAGVERAVSDSTVANPETSQISELVLRNTAQALRDVASNLLTAAKCACESYSVVAASRNQSFREMRGQVARVIVDYKETQLPQSLEFVSGLKQIFSYYEVMDQDTFKEVGIEVILEEVTKCAPNADEVSQRNGALLHELNRHHKQALAIIASLTRDHEVGMAKASIMRSSQEKVHQEEQPTTSTATSGSMQSVTAAYGRQNPGGDGLGLSSPPASDRHGKGLWINSPGAFIRRHGKSVAAQKNREREIMMSKAAEQEGNVRAIIAEEEQALLDLCTAKMIEEILFPALRRFTEAENEVTGFFSALKKEVNYLAESTNDSPNRLLRVSSHLTIMQNGREGILEACDAYIKNEASLLAQIGVLSTNLERGMDNEPNYITEWLDRNPHHAESTKHVEK